MQDPKIELLESQIAGHIEHLTQEMRDSFRQVNSRLEKLETAVTTVTNTLTDHRETLLSHGQLIREQSRRMDAIDGKLDQILQFMKKQQEGGE
jgi:ABC-type transporter Mla subunit MlaD